MNITVNRALHRRCWLVTENPITDTAFVDGSRVCPKLLRTALRAREPDDEPPFYYKLAAGVRSYAGF